MTNINKAACFPAQEPLFKREVTLYRYETVVSYFYLTNSSKGEPLKSRHEDRGDGNFYVMKLKLFKHVFGTLYTLGICSRGHRGLKLIFNMEFLRYSEI